MYSMNDSQNLGLKMRLNYRLKLVSIKLGIKPVVQYLADTIVHY